MAVSVKVKKSAQSATAMMVDRIIELRAQVEAVSPAQKELDKLVKELRAKAMEQDPDQVVSFDGNKGTVVFGEAAKTRVLTDMAGAKKKLGNDLFMEVAKITLGDLDKYLSADELAPLIEESRGVRKIDFMVK